VLSLEVSDNGVGLAAEDLAKAQSFGLRGLHERAGTVGGWIDLSSGAAGTSLILSVPLTDEDGGARPGLTDTIDDPDSAGTLSGLEWVPPGTRPSEPAGL
jgi:hypothetical protein